MREFNSCSMICKSLLLFGIILFCTDTNAQILKGTSVITGDLYSRYTTREDNSGTTKDLDLSLSPAIGVFLAQNFSLNIALGVSYKNHINPSSSGDYEYKTTTYFAQPYLQFYKTVTDKLYLNSQIYFKYGLSEEKSKIPSSIETTINTNEMEIGIRPGITYFLTDRTAMSASLGTIGFSNSSTEDNSNKTMQFVTSFGFSSLSFGISFYLSKKI